MGPGREKVWTDGLREWTDGQRQNYIPPTLSGDNMKPSDGPTGLSAWEITF